MAIMKAQLPLFIPAPAQLPGQADMLDLLNVQDAPEDAPQSRTRPAPMRGALCTVPGSGIGPCTFYREHRSGAWLLMDQRCRQYHAYRPERVRVSRQNRSAML
jgi:hypothetical protein